MHDATNAFYSIHHDRVVEDAAGITAPGDEDLIRQRVVGASYLLRDAVHTVEQAPGS